MALKRAVFACVLCVFSIFAIADLPEVTMGDFYQNEVQLKLIYDESQVLKIKEAIPRLTLSNVQTGAFIELVPGHQDIWFAFRLYNDSPLPLHQVFYLSENIPQQFDLYLNDNSTVYSQSGAAVQVKNRTLPSRNLGHAVKLPPFSSANLYFKMRVKQRGEAIELKTSSHNEFFMRTAQQNTLYGLYFGGMFSILLYNLFLYVSLRDKLYLFYLLSSGTFVLWVASLQGFMAYVSGGGWIRTAGSAMVILSAIGLNLFLRTLLNLDQWAKFHRQVLDWVIALLVVTLVLVLVDQSFMYFASLIATPITLYYFALAIIGFFKKAPFGRYVLLGISFYIIGLLLYFVLPNQVLEQHPLLKYSFILGGYLEAIIFSLALASRVQNLRKETVYYQQSLLEMQDKEHQRLENLVAERTSALERANHELLLKSNYDGLTGVANRRYFDVCLLKQWEQHLFDESPFSIVLCDIDHFKKFNDDLGHLLGDQCLQIVASTLVKSLKEEVDMVARFGGEEFALLLPRTSSGQAMAIAQRVQENLQQVELPDEVGSRQLTLSFGVCTTLPDAEHSARDLVEQADVALYKSKRDGRNRITLCAKSKNF